MDRENLQEYRAEIRRLFPQHSISKPVARGVFFVERGKERLKLRVCEDEQRAREIEERVQGVLHVFPRFYGRHGHCLIFEALNEFRTLTREEFRKGMRGIAHIYAAAHLHEERRPHDQRSFVMKRLDTVRRRGTIDDLLHSEVKSIFEYSLSKLGGNTSLEFVDVHEGNFMVNGSGKLSFVDEAGLGYRTKGLGIGRFLHKIDHNEWEEFVRGYEEVAGGDRIASQTLVRYAATFEQVRSIYAKRDMAGQEESIRRSVARLRDCIAGKSLFIRREFHAGSPS